MTVVNGYVLDAEPLRNGICQSFRAKKEGKEFFFKVYRYDVEDTLTPEKHMAAQEKIGSILASIGNITEDILDHGIMDADTVSGIYKAKAYYQVKRWCVGSDGAQCSDFQKTMNDEHKRIRSASNAVDARRLYTELYKNVLYITALIKRCHGKKLIHQDLKPEQILMVPFEGSLRPMVADFDWSFVEGDKALKNVGTLMYHSPEHLLEKDRERASDVFTLAIIIFKALSLGYHPLISDAELDDWLSPEQINEFIKRCEVRQSLIETVKNSKHDLNWDQSSVEKVQAVLQKCLAPDPVARPTASELWGELKSATPISAKDESSSLKPTPGPTPGPVSPSPAGIQTWFRLRPPGGVPVDDDFITVSIGTDGQTVGVDRAAVKGVFRLMADEEGNPVYKYWSKSGPNLRFRREGDRWEVWVPEGCKNSFVLESADGNKIDVGSSPVSLKIGSKLILFSATLKRELTECAWVVSNS